MATPLVPNPDPAIDLAVPAQPVDDLFPLIARPCASDTFEIGLTLGGTVSAAAYTAGVLDFLIEALDAWTLAKQAGTAPHHNVRIKILSGTSGGAISCVLLSRILGSAFPPVYASTPQAARDKNPLYHNWVDQIDITDLLELSDLTQGTITSLLCADKLKEVGTEIANYQGDPLGTGNTPQGRDYFEPHLPVVLTLTNLRGVPYRSDFSGNSKRPEYYVDHADHIRFKVDIRGNNPPTPAEIAPYEIAVSNMGTPGIQPWTTIINAARGSSAFPVGLPAIKITRPVQHYCYRYAVIAPNAVPQAVWLRPAWPYMIPIGSTTATPYTFATADGGCFNNEPTEFARQWLAGVLGVNERDGAKAHRAVVLVDPFADAPSLDYTDEIGLLKAASGTLSAFVGGARYDTADLDLFTEEEVYSRFLVNPVREVVRDGKPVTLTGGDAIATNPLGAFGGFLSRAYREHDFLLGRRNCQQFLRRVFVLKAENPLFDGWTATQRQQYAATAPAGCLPVVPLVGALAQALPQPDWPKDKFQPKSIHDAVDKRLGKLVTLGATAVIGDPSWLESWAVSLAVSKLADMGTDKIISLITAGLKSADLLSGG